MIVNIEDLRRVAKRRLPKPVFEFIDGGAEDELTLKENRAAFARYQLRPRVLVDVSRIDASTTLMGQPIDAPLMLAPTGLCGMATAFGEMHAVRAARRQNIGFAVSCMSSMTLEQVMQAAPGPHWFQLYVWRDREITRSVVERAAAAGYAVLAVTVDTQVPAKRERDIRNGAVMPIRITPRNAFDVLRKPSWLLRMAKNPRVDFANYRDATVEPMAGAFTAATRVSGQFDPSVDWRTLEWVRQFWPGRVALKGVITGDDARRAVDVGVDAIIVSNHGGRQLDSCVASVDALPEVVEAVGDRAEVILDGGIRRGSDVIKAVALGARACMIGRPYVYGLAAGDQAGAEKAIAILKTEIATTLALMGRPSLADIDRSVLSRRE